MSAVRTLVLGLGNEILSDDGVGIQAARRVRELAGDRVNVAEACVATIDLLWLMSGYDRVVIIDSFLSPDLPPGTAVRVVPDDLPEGFGYRSFHSLTFREIVDIGNWLGLPFPGHITIHGLSVSDTSTFGQTFSPEVAEVWEEWAENILDQEFGLERTRALLPQTDSSPATFGGRRPLSVSGSARLSDNKPSTGSRARLGRAGSP